MLAVMFVGFCIVRVMFLVTLLKLFTYIIQFYFINP